MQSEEGSNLAALADHGGSSQVDNGAVVGGAVPIERVPPPTTTVDRAVSPGADPTDRSSDPHPSSSPSSPPEPVQNGDDDDPPLPNLTSRPPGTSYSLSSSELRQRRVILRHHNLPVNAPSASTASSISSSSSSSSQAPPASRGTPSSPGSSSAAPAASSDPRGKSPDQDRGASTADEDALYQCNICLDMASSPVVTLCGHLFCWPCVHRWLESRLPASNTCPVCKSALEKAKLIPIYARGRTEDPRATSPPIPDRPAGQRTEAPPNPRRFGFGGQPFGPDFNINTFHGNVHFGLGLFPGLGFQFNLGGPAPDQQGAVAQQQAFVSRIFLLIGALIFLGILLY
ncbi:hypothetical protein DFJ73DRAFT_859214 [Zopfochytrium polystomum]|nr:hypothetical protein DFJ73DRAFT_859214 [Zopfochytrium polystomum]